MAELRRLAGLVHCLLAALAGGCTDVRSAKDTTRASGVPSGRSAAPSVVVATASPARAPADDSVVVRARAILLAARPRFHEWPPSAYAPEPPDGGIPGATTGHLLGDFDGDGMPDVVFDGYDGRVMVMPAVLSNNGHPKIVPVMDSSLVADPPAPREVRFVVASDTLNGGKIRFGVELVMFDRNRLAMERSGFVFVYVDGHFVQLEGD